MANKYLFGLSILLLQILHLAAMKGDKEDGWTPLHEACFQGDVAKTTLLLNNPLTNPHIPTTKICARTFKYLTVTPTAKGSITKTRCVMIPPGFLPVHAVLIGAIYSPTREKKVKEYQNILKLFSQLPPSRAMAHIRSEHDDLCLQLLVNKRPLRPVLLPMSIEHEEIQGTAIIEQINLISFKT